MAGNACDDLIGRWKLSNNMIGDLVELLGVESVGYLLFCPFCGGQECSFPYVVSL